MLPKEFIKFVSSPAMEFQMETNIFSSVSIAQACLETGHGKSIPIDHVTKKNSNNIFGVKWNGEGDYVISLTREVIGGKSILVYAKFQAYKNVYESLEAHSRLLGTAKRYQPVRDAKTPEEQCKQLYLCGYATDAPPEIDGDAVYYDKLINIIKLWDLKQYDMEVLVMKGQIKELQKQVKELQEKQSKEIPVPIWAEASVKYALEKGWISEPVTGSYDFWRFITILHRTDINRK